MEAEVSVEKISVQDYLESERKSDIKHEYDNGTPIPISGASYFHNLICSNLIRVLGNAFLTETLTVHSADLRIAVQGSKKYYYPDVVLLEGNPEFTDDHFDTVKNPFMILEVLSESTERYDRGDKFQAYRTLQSLQVYVLVAQDKPLVEVFTKDADTGQWILSEAHGLGSSIQLPNMKEKLILSDIYAKVKFPQK